MKMKQKIKESANRYIKKFDELEAFIKTKLNTPKYDYIIEPEHFSDKTESTRDKK